MVLKQLFGSYINIIVDKIDQYSPPIRKRDFSTKYCLKHICWVLKTGAPWSSIKTICHFTTIYKRFIEWKSNDVFEIIWKDILNEYTNKQLLKDPKWANIMYIDSTMIKNVLGSDSLGRNHYDRNRWATKQSIICDINKVPLSCSYYGANIHDVKTIEESLQKLTCKYRLDKRYVTNIVGDKGYIINQQKRSQLFNTYKMKLVTPKRCNQLHSVTKQTKALLKERYKVEHVFCRLDKFIRLRSRVDRYIDNYESFNYLAMVSITIKTMS